MYRYILKLFGLHFNIMQFMRNWKLSRWWIMPWYIYLLGCASALCISCKDGSSCDLCTDTNFKGTNCDVAATPCNTTSKWNGASCEYCNASLAGCLICNSGNCLLCDMKFVLVSTTCQSNKMKRLPCKL